MTAFITPIGTNPPSPEARKPVMFEYSGNVMKLRTFLYTTPDNTTPVTPHNCTLDCKLAESQFDNEALWEGTWGHGIEMVDETYHPGLVEVTFPTSVTDKLRRGGYRFAIKVDTLTSSYVAVDGGLMIEYATTSPEHGISYVYGSDT